MYTSSASASAAATSTYPAVTGRLEPQEHPGPAPLSYVRADSPASDQSPPVVNLTDGQREIQMSWQAMSDYAERATASDRQGLKFMTDYLLKRIRHDANALPSVLKKSMAPLSHHHGFGPNSQCRALTRVSKGLDFGLNNGIAGIFDRLKNNLQQTDSTFVHSLRVHYDSHLNADTVRALYWAADAYVRANKNISQWNGENAVQFFQLLVNDYVPNAADKEGLRILLTQPPGYVQERVPGGEPIVWHNPAILDRLPAVPSTLFPVPEQPSGTLKRSYSVAGFGPDDRDTGKRDQFHGVAPPFTRADPNADASDGGPGGPALSSMRFGPHASGVVEVPLSTVLSVSGPPSEFLHSAPRDPDGDSTVLPPDAAALPPPWTVASASETVVDARMTGTSQISRNDIHSSPQDLDHLMQLFNEGDPWPNLTPQHIAGLLQRRNPDQ